MSAMLSANSLDDKGRSAQVATGPIRLEMC